MSRALIAGAILGAGLVSGGIFIQGGGAPAAAADPGSPRLFDEVLARVRNDYIDSIPDNELYRRAALGLARELALRRQRREGFGDFLPALLRCVEARIEKLDAMSRLRSDLRDPGPHCAGAEHGDGGTGRKCRHVQRPWNRGGRLPTNAATPSR